MPVINNGSEPITVAVIIATFNHAHFLADAIGSALAQSRPADEIIAVDDGSTDDPKAIVDRFPTLRLIRQENRGVASARNTGLYSCCTSHVVFLDADDLLLPHALETGVKFWAEHSECAFVYGGHRYVSETLQPLHRDIFIDVGEDPHRDLLVRNAIGMLATALFRRDRLIEVDGFDETVRCCEDHDLYLRLAFKYPIAGYPVTTALYRRHGASMTADRYRMYRSVLSVLDRHEARLPPDESTRLALKLGREKWRDLYLREIVGAARSELTTLRLSHV
jgi:glycosyltransferase involved in cell wall biosynthesis